MNKITQTLITALALRAVMTSAFAAELSVVTNFREYSPSLASSGQPLQVQFELLKSDLSRHRKANRRADHRRESEYHLLSDP